MRLASSPGRSSGDRIPRGTASGPTWLVVVDLAIVVLLVIAAAACGTDEPRSVETPTPDFAEMFGGDDASSSRSSPSTSTSTGSDTEDIGIDSWYILGVLWSVVWSAIELLLAALWGFFWEILKVLSPLLAVIAFVFTVWTIMGRSWYYERWNAVPRALGLGVLASAVPLLIWIFA